MEKNNKLIAEFMGLDKEYKMRGVVDYYCPYNVSWDWLMPVISKITKDERCVENEYRERIMDVVPYGNIEDTIKTVVEFIKEYNQNN